MNHFIRSELSTTSSFALSASAFAVDFEFWLSCRGSFADGRGYFVRGEGTGGAFLLEVEWEGDGWLIESCLNWIRRGLLV